MCISWLGQAELPRIQSTPISVREFVVGRDSILSTVEREGRFVSSCLLSDDEPTSACGSLERQVEWYSDLRLVMRSLHFDQQ